MSSQSNKTRRRKLLVRVLVIAAAALVVLAVSGVVGYQIFAGWRARDLAAKAKDNFEKENYRIAWLQINSAKELRPEEPDVLRVLGMIEGAMGRATALEYYDKLSRKADLTPEDLLARAEIATRFGDDAQFAEAAEALEKSGQKTEAGRLRTARMIRQGDLDSAIIQARAAAETTGDSGLVMAKLRLLVQRFVPEFRPGKTPSPEARAGMAEALELVDALMETPQRDEALAFALNEMNPQPETRARWVAAAMENVQAGNPALLPAAALLVRSGEKTPAEMHAQLRPVFDAAPLERRASYALWLTGAGLPKEALTMVTAQEASESTAAFGALTEALFATENLEAVLAAVEAGGNVDADIRLAAKARAEYARGRGTQGGAAALREALDAAAKARRLDLMAASGDALGATAVVDTQLAELCGDPSVSDHVFRVARDRFSRRGRPSLLQTAFERARDASPQSPAVQDYARYQALLANGEVSLEETAAAMAAEPGNTSFRVTHALNLLRRNQPVEALAVFDDITVFADRLPPGQLAVIAAVLAANGDNARARAAAAVINPDLMSPDEYALIVPLRFGASFQ